MIKLNLQMFGGRGGGSGGAGGGAGGKSDGGNTASDGGPGSGRGGGGRLMDGEKRIEPKSLFPNTPPQYGPAKAPEQTRSSSNNGNVLKLEKNEKYTLYKVKDNGNESEYDTNMSASDVKEIIRGSSPDPKTGLWKDKKTGRMYRVVRSR